MNDGIFKALVAVGIIIMIAIWAVINTQASECSKQGGQYVRGLVGYTCIK